MDVTDSTFEKEVIKASHKTPVLVDFWAAWCGPCQMLKPILEKLSKEMHGKVIIAKLDVDANPASAEKYEIMSIPSVKLFKKGEVVDEFMGARPEGFIKSWIQERI